MDRLSEVEFEFLAHGLAEWDGPAHLSDSTARALGYRDGSQGSDDARRLRAQIMTDRTVSLTDLQRTVVLCEIAFVSNSLGAGREWEDLSPEDDEQSFRRLRSIQTKLDRLQGSVSLNGASTRIDKRMRNRLVGNTLTDRETRFVSAALTAFITSLDLSDDLSIAVGYESAADMMSGISAMIELVDESSPMTAAAWARTIRVCEIVFGSSSLGLGNSWPTSTGLDDDESFADLRSFQNKYSRYEAIW